MVVLQSEKFPDHPEFLVQRVASDAAHPGDFISRWVEEEIGENADLMLTQEARLASPIEPVKSQSPFQARPQVVTLLDATCHRVEFQSQIVEYLAVPLIEVAGAAVQGQ